MPCLAVATTQNRRRLTNGTLLPVGGNPTIAWTALARGQRVVDRTATFVFFLGDRFFGTITAYVPGAVAGSYHFTSAVEVQLLKALEPQLDPLLKSPASEAAPLPISEALPVVTGLGEQRRG